MLDKPTGNQPGTTKKRVYQVASKWLPWVIGGAVLVYLIWKIDPRQLLEALAQAQLWLYIPSLVVFVYISFLIDAQNLHALLRNFNYAVSFSESMLVRGASYLINVVDYTLGMGSVVYFWNVTAQISLLRGAAIMIYYNYINQIALIVLTTAGYLLLRVSQSWLSKGIMVCLIMVGLTVVLIALVKKSQHKWAAAVRNVALAQSFIESSARIYFKNIIYRVGYYFSYVLFFYAAIRAFHMDIPFITLLAYVPIILLVISIPISPFGLGTSQATMLFLFRDFGSQPQILAFSLAYSLSVLLLRTILGAYYYWNMAGRINMANQRGKGGSEIAGKANGETA